MEARRARDYVDGSGDPLRAQRDVAIAYRVFGEGPFDVVYHPGFISHVELMTEMPTYQGRIVDALASFARVIAFDQRGGGMSDRMTGTPSLETRVDDVRAVMDAAGCSRAAILSASVGVPMSVLFAATYPERTSALVLVRGYARHLWASDYPWGWTLERHLSMVKAYQLLFGSRREAAEALGGPALYSDDDLEYFRRAAASPGTIETNATIDREVDVRRVLPAVRVPTLILHPAEDPAFPIGSARYMAERIPAATLIEVPEIARLTDVLIDEAKRFLCQVFEAGGWGEPEPDRVLATILFTDIVGSTEIAASLGDKAWHELLERHHALVRRELVHFRGREVNTAGDGFFASFDGPARAIRCACTIVESSRELDLQIRAGLHTGECDLVDGKVAGIAVHTGARVAEHAQPSEVLVSSTVKDLVAGSNLVFQDRGSHELKGLPGEWHLFSHELKGLPGEWHLFAADSGHVP
jgi:class 3 adenylate cyclase/pimeloyl-ACP methyl ester carboxylesterase